MHLLLLHLVLCACAPVKNAAMPADTDLIETIPTDTGLEVEIDTPPDEVCNGKDDDLDGFVDEDATDAVAWYPDVDGDGYGDSSMALMLCPGAPETKGRVLQGRDCDDTDPNRNPRAREVCDEVDQDCDGVVDEHPTDVRETYLDADSDGYGLSGTSSRVCSMDYRASRDGDCDDGNPDVHPYATEICDDGLDNDCNGFLLGYNGLESHLVSEAPAYVYGPSAESIGGAVAGPGDLDGDGLDDMLVGQMSWYTGGSPVVRVISGPVHDRRDAEHPDATLVAYIADGAMAGPGDVNGDGFADVLLGIFDGTASLFYGPPVGAIHYTAADIVIRLTTSTTYAVSVSGAGDQTGDSLPDIAVAVLAVDDDGTLYVMPGNASVSADEALFVLRGTSSDSGLRKVGLAGDVNGDGQPDLIVSRYSTARDDEVALILGPVSGDLEFSEADLLIDGTGHALGQSLAGVQDTNGDGLDDVVLGAPDGGTGRAYLYQGQSESLLELSAELVGTEDDDHAGYAVAGPGDLDGDGFADIAVGAPYASTDGSSWSHQSGWVAIRLGPVSGLLSLEDSEGFIAGSDSYEGAGFSVAGVGDTTGDGTLDLMVGVPGFRGASVYSKAVLFTSFFR